MSVSALLRGRRHVLEELGIRDDAMVKALDEEARSVSECFGTLTSRWIAAIQSVRPTDPGGELAAWLGEQQVPVSEDCSRSGAGSGRH